MRCFGISDSEALLSVGIFLDESVKYHHNLSIRTLPLPPTTFHPGGFGIVKGLSKKTFNFS